MSDSTATLSWSASSDDVGVVGYGLYVGGLRIATTTQTSYAFSGLSCGSNYTFGVDAYDAAGNRSPVATMIVTTSSLRDDTAAWGRHEPADGADESLADGRLGLGRDVVVERFDRRRRRDRLRRLRRGLQDRHELRRRATPSRG